LNHLIFLVQEINEEEFVLNKNKKLSGR